MARYLIRNRHNNQLYFRFVLPRLLRHQLGRREVRRSLLTTDLQLGKLRAMALAVKFKVASMAHKSNPAHLGIAKLIHDLENKRVVMEGITIDPNHHQEDTAALLALTGALPATTSTAPGKTYDEAVAAYMAVRPTIRAKTQDEYVTVFRDYGDWCKANNRDAFAQPTAAAYVEQLIASSLSVTTKNKRIRRLSSLFIWCADRGYVAKNIFHRLSLPKPKKRVADERRAYTHAEVSKLLANLTPATDERHWVVLLGLYVGARGNELASLYLKDIRIIQGIPCIHFIEDSPDKRKQKTINGERVVPIPQRLLDIGFMEWVESLREAGKTRLFDMWSHHPKNGYWQSAGKWYRDWRKAIGIERNFHELRHTWETALRDADVSETLAAELAGHAKGETQSFNRYAKPGHLANLRDAINKLPINPGRKAGGC